MRLDNHTPQSSRHLRIDVFPEPTEEELVAILQALEVLRAGSVTGEATAQPADESFWGQRARYELLRDRNWPPQVRSWTFRRS